MADIFISYASVDIERVKPLAKALEDQGWSVWWDRTIPVAKTWHKVIEEEVDNAKSIVVVWSNASVSSDWVMAEAEDGLKRRILVPTLIEDVRLPLLFRSVQAADLINWQGEQSDQNFKQLKQALNSILGARSKPIESIVQKPSLLDIEQNDADSGIYSEKEILFQEGNRLDRSNQYEEAITAFEKALKIDPKYSQAWANKGLSLRRLGRYEEAIASFNKALEINPNYNRVKENKRDTLKEMEFLDQNEAFHDIKQESDPDLYWFEKGNILDRSKRYEEAILAFDKALETNPDYAQAWANKGLSLKRLGRFEEAITAFNMALEINPNYTRAQNNKSDTLRQLRKK